MTRLITFSTVARIIAAALLFWALAKHPYDYFTLLRWVTSATAAYTAYVAYKQDSVGWVWILGVIAVLFNPLFIVRFNRQTWKPIDVAVGITLLISLWFVQETRSKTQHQT